MCVWYNDIAIELNLYIIFNTIHVGWLLIYGHGINVWSQKLLLVFLIISKLYKFITDVYLGGQKNVYDDIISAVYDFFDQWDPNTSTPM